MEKDVMMPGSMKGQIKTSMNAGNTGKSGSGFKTYGTKDGNPASSKGGASIKSCVDSAGNQFKK